MPGYAVTGTPEPLVEAPVWQFLASADRPASVHDLHVETGAHPNSIQHRLARWVNAGLVTRHEGRPKRYAMNDTTERSPLPPQVSLDGQARPREHTAREKLWRAMRVLPSFDVPTLMMTGNTTRRSAEDLVNVLHRSGHLRQLVRGNPTTGTWSSYRLIRNTGPKAPKVSHHLALDGRRRREVVDMNTGRRTDISPAAVSLRKKSTAPIVDGGVS